MNDQMRKILESKRAMRQKLEALPFAEKTKSCWNGFALALWR